MEGSPSFSKQTNKYLLVLQQTKVQSTFYLSSSKSARSNKQITSLWNFQLQISEYWKLSKGRLQMKMVTRISWSWIEDLLGTTLIFLYGDSSAPPPLLKICLNSAFFVPKVVHFHLNWLIFFIFRVADTLRFSAFFYLKEWIFVLDLLTKVLSYSCLHLNP